MWLCGLVALTGVIGWGSIYSSEQLFREAGACGIDAVSLARRSVTANFDAALNALNNNGLTPILVAIQSQSENCLLFDQKINIIRRFIRYGARCNVSRISEQNATSIQNGLSRLTNSAEFRSGLGNDRNASLLACLDNIQISLTQWLPSHHVEAPHNYADDQSNREPFPQAQPVTNTRAVELNLDTENLPRYEASLPGEASPAYEAPLPGEASPAYEASVSGEEPPSYDRGELSHDLSSPIDLPSYTKYEVGNHVRVRSNGRNVSGVVENITPTGDGHVLYTIKYDTGSTNDAVLESDIVD